MTSRQLIALSTIAVFLAACSKPESESEPDASNDSSAQAPASAADQESGSCQPEPVPEGDIQSVEIAPGLSGRTLVSGCGEAAATGDVAVVHYTGWLFDKESSDMRGEKFDSSHDRNAHFRFPLGGGQVIQGWDKGVAGMQVGEVRELTISPDLAYGERDLGVIPSGSTLVFEVQLADIEGQQPAQ
jgi:FKBP-type peptidyl-prolyl cis-trans isomerase